MASPSGTDPLQQARQLLASGQADKAAEILRALLEISSTDSETNGLMGAALSMNGKLAESMPYLERAVGLDPQKASNYFNLGAVAERMGDTERALICYRKAVQLDPGYKRAAEGVQRLFKPAAPAAPAPQPQVYQQPIRTDLAGNPVYEQPPMPVQTNQPQYPAPSPYAAPGYSPAPGLPQYAAGYPASAYQSRDWEYAPGVVKVLRFLAALAVGLAALGIVVMFCIMIATVGRSSGASVVMLFPMIICVVLGCFYVLIYKAHTNGWTAMWYIQLVFSILGVIGFPIGTIINGLILYYWFQPETKAWYGVT